MRIYKIILLAALLILTAVPTVQAATSPLAVSIVPPVQFPPSDFNVTGLRVGVVGRHRSVYGFDFGLIGNTTDNTFVGLAASGIFNKTNGTTEAIGAQVAGLTNINSKKTSVYGIQLAAGLNYNQAESKIYGLQFALVNLSPYTTVYGFQTGIYNKAKEVYGLQIGLVNVADDLHGVQIGLINFHNKGTFVVSPFLNAGF